MSFGQIADGRIKELEAENAALREAAKPKPTDRAAKVLTKAEVKNTTPGPE